MRRLLWALCVMPFSSAIAGWQVTPTTCVTESAGQSCTMPLIISNADYDQQTICVWLGSTKLSCQTMQQNEIRLDIIYDAESLLAITQNDNVLHQQSLHINTINAKKARRRIRLPWSLF